MSNYIIETKHLTKQYGTQKSVADLSIHVEKGRIYGLLGRNGAGKTTTMKMLLGLTRPTSGEVKIWGKPLQGNEKKLLPRIGSLIESPGFYPNLTATENLRIFATLRGVPNRHAIKDALDLVGLPYKDKKLFSQYSLGMKQRLAIALAVMHDPELLILDEATSGLDPIIRDDVLDMLIDFVQDENHSVLVSSHITSDLEKVADYITFLHKGKLIFTHEKDELVDNYGILSCGAAVFDTLDKSEIVAYRKEDYQFKVLVKDRNKAAKQYPNAIVGPATIEEIMLFYVKGEMQ